MDRLLGLGLKSQHMNHVLTHLPKLGWFEVHSENYLYPESAPTQRLLNIAQHYPISLHGIGLSLGSEPSALATSMPIHLKRLKALMDLIKPVLVSEHLAFNQYQGNYFPDLLPIPYTKDRLEMVCQNVDITQHALGTQILIENPSSYFQYKESYLQEAEFLVQLCQKSGCGILLDVNNIFVSCQNHGWDAHEYIESIPKHLVKEIHVAGHSTKFLPSGRILRIDSHDDVVCPQVMDLYEKAINRFGVLPTLLEWDDKIPAFETLHLEAQKLLVYLESKTHG